MKNDKLGKVTHESGVVTFYASGMRGDTVRADGNGATLARGYYKRVADDFPLDGPHNTRLAALESGTRPEPVKESSGKKLTFREPEFGSEITLDFVPSDYTDCESAARALYAALCKLSREWGQKPEIEVLLLSPCESLRLGTGDNWRVCWEAGPYEWAIRASENCHNMNRHHTGWYTEPYYSFDLCFTD